MPRQYIMTYVDYIDEFEDVAEGYLMSLLDDRMRQSIKNNFKDKTGYYVIFTIQEIMQRVKVGKNKAINLLSDLTRRDYVVKKRGFNQATRLYLPKFNFESPKSLENKHAKVYESNSNQSHLNQTNKSELYTSDTGDEHNSRVNNWKESVVDSSKLPALAIDKIIDYTKGNTDRAYQIVGLIHKAKANIVRRYKLANSKLARYETNRMVQQRLMPRLNHLFNYSRKARHEDSYLMSGLKTFFTEALGIKQDTLEQTVYEQNEPIKAYEPEWLNKDYQPDDQPVTAAEKEQMLKRLAAFNAH